MTSPIGGIVPFGVGALGATGATGPAAGPPRLSAAEAGEGFAAVLAATFDNLQTARSASDDLLKQAMTGDLKDVHDYMIASTEAGVATEMVVAFKNKAVEAFNEIMRMPI